MTSDTRDPLAQLMLWQEFTAHPCFVEWMEALEGDLEAAEDILHSQTDPRDAVAVATAMTYRRDVAAMREYAAGRIAELKMDVQRSERESG